MYDEKTLTLTVYSYVDVVEYVNEMKLNKDREDFAEHLVVEMVDKDILNEKDGLNVEGNGYLFGYLKDISITPNNPRFKSIDGIVYTKNGKILTYCPQNMEGEIVVPDGVEEIAESAFMYSKISRITFPKTLKIIRRNAFWFSMLEEAAISEGFEEIEDDAFIYCNNLRKFNFVSSIKRIGSQAFFRCYNLEKIDLNEGLEHIGQCAFQYCMAEEIRIPSSLIEAGDGDFPDVKNVYMEKYNSSLLAGCVHGASYGGAHDKLPPFVLLHITGYPVVVIPRYVDDENFQMVDIFISVFIETRDTAGLWQLYSFSSDANGQGSQSASMYLTAMEAVRIYDYPQVKSYLTKYAKEIGKNFAKKGEEKFLEMLKYCKWRPAALKKFLDVADENRFIVAKAYILEMVKKVEKRDVFEV